MVEIAPGAVAVETGAPLGEQLGALHGVGGEQPGQPPSHGIAAGGAVVGRVAAAEVGREVVEPRRAHHVVDDGQQRPGEPVGIPRVVRVLAEQHRDQGVGCDEVDSGADAVTAARADAEAVRQPLGQPALHAARRHHHDLAGERIGQGSDQQVGQAVGQRIGALGGVEVHGHVSTL